MIVASSGRPPSWWLFCAPYLRKLIVAALARKGMDASDWPVS